MPSRVSAALFCSYVAVMTKALLVIALLATRVYATDWTTPANAPKGSVENRSIGARSIWVHTPAEYTTSTHAYELLVLFDGDSYITDIPAPVVLDNLVAAKKIKPAIAVMIDNSSNRLGDLANHAAFADFCAKELVPWMRAKYRIKPGAASITLGGYSAGGLAAAYVAFKHPETFGNVLSQSGAFWRGNEGASAPGEWLTEEFRKSPKLPLRFVLDVGAKETQQVVNGAVFVETVRRLRDVLQSKQYEVHYVEVPNATHSPEHWRASFAGDLLYLLHP